MTKRSALGLRALCALGFAASLASACGGRVIMIDGSGGEGSTSAGAANHAAGATYAGASSYGGGPTYAGASSTGGYGYAGAPSYAGAASAGAYGYAGAPSTGGASNYAGAPSAGAGGTCGGVACPGSTCPVDSVPVLLPGACCVVCESSCAQQVCPAIACASGYQPQTAPGQCCPICQPSPTIDCTSGQKDYLETRAIMADKYSRGCAVDQDCVLAPVINACDTSCSHIAVSRKLQMDLEPALDNLAAIDCAACNEPPILACPGESPGAACLSGQCYDNALK